MSKKIILPLESYEKKELRKNKIRLNQLSKITPNQLSNILNISIKRSKEIIAHAQIQQVPSIGPKLTNNIINLGFYSLEEIKNQDGANLTDLLEKKYGCWVDPCVEDQLRLVIHYANNGETGKQWWDFTKDRKEFRAKKGYPPDRPTISCEKKY